MQGLTIYWHGAQKLIFDQSIVLWPSLAEGKQAMRRVQLLMVAVVGARQAAEAAMLVNLLVRRLFRLHFMICRTLNIFEPFLLGSICRLRLCRA